ncbi:DUF4810 domain-containing protein [Xanthomonas dyei]|uniref:DUF4810 domain-containing protein n=1 Tax=Xanthomonas dyei TaxID=743699 RepID=A0A2S7BX65_9XANT|nr:DUF4810 domain-containing protein [Xanthomonas dyei]MCC4634771.1 DUF4810 domain-containing protein [Xanthomonas dyei pv. eucalypti]PPU50098.1 DUF4810 domain-containing protein [Xanthomonas dyei]WOB26608.1 DUF4810 domain-containing protein [Xanthomonas dyei]WOB54227.1 DUF4810 domain-containing protein [Xanthomonas dyei]
MKKMSYARRCLSVCALLALTACAHQSASLYQWGSYQDQVYSHFKGGSPEQQIQALEKDMQVMQSSNKSTPPGLRVHLGMLYAETGNDSKAQENLIAEKAQYPESATYVDLLMKKFQHEGQSR